MIVFKPEIIKDDFVEVTGRCNNIELNNVFTKNEWINILEKERIYNNRNIIKYNSFAMFLYKLGKLIELEEKTFNDSIAFRINFVNQNKKSEWHIVSSKKEARIFIEKNFISCSYCGEFKFLENKTTCKNCNRKYLLKD